ncbi:hypothetical protein THAOC_02092, partial [Thalassiosira oceanica]
GPVSIQKEEASGGEQSTKQPMANGQPVGSALCVFSQGYLYQNPPAKGSTQQLGDRVQNYGFKAVAVAHASHCWPAAVRHGAVDREARRRRRGKRADGPPRGPPLRDARGRPPELARRRVRAAGRGRPPGAARRVGLPACPGEPHGRQRRGRREARRGVRPPFPPEDGTEPPQPGVHRAEERRDGGALGRAPGRRGRGKGEYEPAGERGVPPRRVEGNGEGVVVDVRGERVREDGPTRRGLRRGDTAGERRADGDAGDGGVRGVRREDVLDRHGVGVTQVCVGVLCTVDPKHELAIVSTAEKKIDRVDVILQALADVVLEHELPRFLELGDLGPRVPDLVHVVHANESRDRDTAH